MVSLQQQQQQQQNGTKDLNCKKIGLTTLFQLTVKHPVMERENAGYKIQWKWTIGMR